MRLLGGQVRAMRGSDLIRSGHSATGTIGTALAGEVTAARLRVPGSPLGFRGGRWPRHPTHAAAHPRGSASTMYLILLTCMLHSLAFVLQVLATVLFGFTVALVARTTVLLGFSLALVVSPATLFLGTLVFKGFTLFDFAFLHKFDTTPFLGSALAFLSLAPVLLPLPTTLLPLTHSFLSLTPVLDALSFSHFLGASLLGEDRGSNKATDDDQGQGFQTADHGALLVGRGTIFVPACVLGQLGCSRSGGRCDRNFDDPALVSIRRLQTGKVWSCAQAEMNYVRISAAHTVLRSPARLAIIWSAQALSCSMVDG